MIFKTNKMIFKTNKMNYKTDEINFKTTNVYVMSFQKILTYQFLKIKERF